MLWWAPETWTEKKNPPVPGRGSEDCLGKEFRSMKFRVVHFANGRTNPPTKILSRHQTHMAAISAVESARKRALKQSGAEYSWKTADVWELYAIQKLHGEVWLTRGYRTDDWS
jgi:hypothetical protein